MFKENTNRFYRHLGAKAIEVTAHPNMQEVEFYWQAIWEMETRHNEKAEWIRREEKGREGTSNMKWMPIKTTEFTLVLAKTHNWKSPGSDQIQNYWLKAFPVMQLYCRSFQQNNRKTSTNARMADYRNNIPTS